MSEQKTIEQVLIEIQQHVICPKSTKKDNFYAYRHVEEIQQAVKSQLIKHKASIIISDDIISLATESIEKKSSSGEVGTKNVYKFWVKATATFLYNGQKLEATAFAEVDNNNRMSKSQQTGSASSYARKYALGGLLMLDDRKDADDLHLEQELKNTSTPKPYQPPQMGRQIQHDAIPSPEVNALQRREYTIAKIKDLLKNPNLDPVAKTTFIEHVQNAEIETLTIETLDSGLEYLQNRIR